MINISVDIKAVQRTLDKARRDAVPKASAKAINALAFDVMRAERAAIAEVFKTPRPFTQKAFLVKQGSVSNPTATVFARPEANQYLAPYEFGGTHFAASGLTTDPENIKLDQYGQIRRGQLKRLREQKAVFSGTIHGVNGLWQRKVTNTAPRKRRKTAGQSATVKLPRTKLSLLVQFKQPTSVTEHLGFEARAQMVVKANFMTEFRSALDRLTK